MAQSLSRVIIHVVFGTKHRAPVLDATIRPALHAYLAAVARNLNCVCYSVGGVSDHVHLAIGLSRTITLAKLVEVLKTSSSKWLKTQSKEMASFSWQGGYAVFSVNPLGLETLRRYIDKQESHHRKKNFQEEYHEILEKYEVEFDERYLWD
ncbi:MAG: IS200/IS605 family transposase [Saprospiraceae bacterium]|nr:IS200/IS605 family transposase [Saprospiraceae bacterium]